MLANPRFEQMFGWPPRRPDRPARAGGLGRARTTTPRSAAGRAGAGARRAGRDRARGRRRDGSTFLAPLRGQAPSTRRTPRRGGTIWIVEDVTERRQFEQALARARDDAEAASRAKSAFLANTSHELRTPLNGMIGLARLARAPGRPSRSAPQYLDQIADSAESLAGIISDILDLSKIEAGKLPIETTVFDLGELLRAVQRAYATLAERAAGCDFGIALDVQACRQVGDPLRVRQILSNFLNNALKFTAHGQVRVRRAAWPAPTPSACASRSHDTGPGIDAATRERGCSGPSPRPTSRRRAATAAPGWACRSAVELAELMGGAVGVDSVPGQGSTFWAELPLPRDRRRRCRSRCRRRLRARRGARADGRGQPREHDDRGGHARALGRRRVPGHRTAARRWPKSVSPPPPAAPSTPC